MELDEKKWDESMMEDVFGEGDVRAESGGNENGEAGDVFLTVFLVDTSGSMEGTVIGTINSIMEELLTDLEKERVRRAVLVLGISDKPVWSSEKPVLLKSLGGWARMKAGAYSNFGRAFGELGDRLLSRDWLPDGKPPAEAAFILFSDGLATDRYEDGLAHLKKSDIFRKGRKMAVCLSEICDRAFLAEFTGDEKKVLAAKSNEHSKIRKKIQEILTL